MEQSISKKAFKLPKSDTGVVALVCSHDVPLLYANLYQSGEKCVTSSPCVTTNADFFVTNRMHYPVALLANLFSTFPRQKFGVLYDIACQFSVSVANVRLNFR